MSVEAIQWAWNIEGLTPVEKLVLLALADHADKNGDRCFPSLERITKMTTGIKVNPEKPANSKVSKVSRSVTRAVAALEDRGLLTRDRSTGRRSTQYHLAVNQLGPDVSVPPNQPGPDVSVQLGRDVREGADNSDVTSTELGRDVHQLGPDVRLTPSTRQGTTTPTPVVPELTARALKLAAVAGRLYGRQEVEAGRGINAIALGRHHRDELIRERAELLEAWAARDDIDDNDAARRILLDRDPPPPKAEQGWTPEDGTPAPAWTPESEPTLPPQRGPAAVLAEIGGRVTQYIRADGSVDLARVIPKGLEP